MNRLAGICAAGLMAVMMSTSIVPFQGIGAGAGTVNVQAAQTVKEGSQVKTFSFGSGIAQKDLTAGIYQADIRAKNASKTTLEDENLFDAQDSMVDGCIDGAAEIEIKEDGSAVVTMKVKALTVFGMTAWGKDWKILSGEDNKETAAVILEGSEEEPSKIQFTVPDTTKNGVNASVVSGGGGASKVILAINWANVTKVETTTPEEPETKPQTKPEQPETKPETKPQTVTVSVPGTIKGSAISYKSVKISWSKVSQASGYEVYQNNKKLADVKSTIYTKSGLKTGSKYTYKVRAYRVVNGKKVYSSYTKSVSLKPTLKKTTKVKVKNSKKRAAVVTWKKVSGASGYRVYRATKKNGKYKLVKTVKGNKSVKYTNKKLKKNKKYYYKVRAYRTVSGKKVFGAYSSKVRVNVRK